MPGQTLAEKTKEFLDNLVKEDQELRMFFRSEEFPNLMQRLKENLPHEMSGFRGGSPPVESNQVLGLSPESFARVSDAILNEHGKELNTFQHQAQYEGVIFTRTLGQGAAYRAASVYD